VSARARARGLLVAAAACVGGVVLGACGGGSARGDEAEDAVVVRTVAPATAVALPVPVQRAAAELFVVGFGGTSARDASVKRLSRRDWGGVMVMRGNVGSGGGGAAGRVRRLTAGIGGRAVAAGFAAPLVFVAGGDGAPSLAGLPRGRPVDARSAGAMAARAASTVRSIGGSVVLGPVADLAQSAGPAARSGFSADPAVAATSTAAEVRAYAAGGVAAAPGAFPGQGGAAQDPSLGPATVGLPLETLREADVVPFTAAVRAGAAVIQMSNAVYAAWDGVTPATLLPEAYDLLRRGTGFRGVALSADLNATTATTGATAAAAAVQALRAGADLLWIPGAAADQEAAYQAVLRALRASPTLRTRAAQALARTAGLRTQFHG
jgi:beta-N-acetylhexosaminidase